MSSAPDPWDVRLQRELDAIAASKTELRDYLDANVEAIERTVVGRGPDSNNISAGAGAHMVANMPAAYIPDFCARSARGEARPYQNCYDLKGRKIGDGPSVSRLHVDQCLPTAAESTRVCYGAVDVNGTGVRFYGDFTLVLKSEMLTDNTIILDRNSYDIERLPLARRLAGKSKSERAAERERIANELAGVWTDLPMIAALKILERFASRRRRLTIGEISDAILADEDYVEVPWLRPGDSARSFGASDLFEVRVAAADVALEERIGARSWSGPTPTQVELTWRRQRREAEEALRASNVAVKVVTTTGRVRS